MKKFFKNNSHNMQSIPHHSYDTIGDNFDRIQQLFPSVVHEVKDASGNIRKELDIDELKKLFNNQYNDNPIERYTLNWPGKRKSLIRANTPITDTLRPVREDSVDFDTTGNLYIEGDNFAVLKTLQHAYMGKVKMIYIDPPYNTGKDFVYNDNFTEDMATYREKTGEIVDGIQMEKNNDTNGRFHSDWLSMMYERLLVARDLLTEDGVIFMSMDENEYLNLGKLCNEVFGEENFIENFIWTKNSTKNLSKTTSTNHEYILCYAKNISVLEEKRFFRIAKEGFEEVKDLMSSFEATEENALEAEKALRELYKKNPKWKGISMYNKVQYDPVLKCLKVYRLSDISAPVATGQSKNLYEVIHPITRRATKSPTRGWGFGRQKMLSLIAENRILFGKDETTVPQFKRMLDDVETEVVRSLIEDFTDGKKELMKLFDGKAYFENAKPTTLLTNFIKLCRNDDIILDFFSGSATTAHAVMQLNAEDGGNRQFILVQIPEMVDEKSEAYKAGYKNICEIGKERIRRAAAKIREDYATQIAERETPLDTGFRVYRLDTTNRVDNELHPFDTTQMNIEDNISAFKSDRSAEDILTEILLREGQMLSGNIKSKKVGDNTIYIIDGGIVACLDKSMGSDLLDAIIAENPHVVVFSDEIFEGKDDIKINTENRIESAFGQGNVMIKVF